MKTTGRGFLLGPGQLDLISMIIIIGLNPVTYLFGKSIRHFSPDTIAYFAMGTDLFYNGLLHIHSWGHVDTGLILPPLYPFLIACGQLFFDGTLDVAEWISALCAVTASISIYLFLRHTADRWVAIAATLLIQINFYYAYVAMRPLAGAVFWLVLALYLLLLLKLLKVKGGTRKALSLLTGLSCGLVFLSKQIGGLLVVHMAAMILFTAMTRSGGERKALVRSLMWGLAGWCMLVLPYSAVIYDQTNHHPLQQSFRRGEYRTAVIDPEVRKEIDRIRALPEKDYRTLYTKRRLMRRLLPDASEMFGFAVTGEVRGPGIMGHLMKPFQDPKAYAERVVSHFMNLRDPLGSFLLYLFLVSCVSPFMLRCKDRGLAERILLPVLILFYLTVVSCFTDIISRYMYILFPFVLMQIAGELFVFCRVLSSHFNNHIWGVVLLCAAYASFAFATPRYFNSLELLPKLGSVEAEFIKMRDMVKGEPVFSLDPFSSYLAGGLYRVLPNDSLEKVAAYGNLTGVRWVLVTWARHTRSELHFYDRAQWYGSPSLEGAYSHLVKLRCETPDGRAVLYEILHEPAETSASVAPKPGPGSFSNYFSR